MLKTIIKGATVAAIVSMGSTAYAGGHAKAWTLDSENSKVAFGSIKKEKVGEVHSFETISGTVSAKGEVSIDIDLASVQTNIDIRNERMIEHVFKGAATANLSATVDMEEIAHMETGAMSIVDVEGVLSFLGQSIEVETEMFVARIADDKAVVTTNDMIFIGAEDAGINDGVSKLMELAKLPGITRTSPVTLRLVFNTK